MKTFFSILIFVFIYFVSFGQIISNAANTSPSIIATFNTNSPQLTGTDTLNNITLNNPKLLMSWMNPNEIWISPVGINGTGNGTKINPYIATNAATFDTLMNGTNYAINATTNKLNFFPITQFPLPFPPNTIIHLMAGTFWTITGFPNYWKIIGEGKDITFLKYVNNAPIYAGSPMIGCGWPFNANGQNNEEVSDLTIDLNVQNNTNTAFCAFGIILTGNNALIKDVKIINWANMTTNGIEEFIALIGNTENVNGKLNTCVNPQMINVDIGAPASVLFSGGVTALDIFTQYSGLIQFFPTPDAGWILGGRITGCSSVVNITNNYSFGIGEPAEYHFITASRCVNGIQIDHNICENLFTAGTTTSNVQGGCVAIYMESGPAKNIVIENNFLSNVRDGILMRSTPFTNSGGPYIIKHNDIFVGTLGEGINMNGSIATPPQSLNWIQGLDIENNLIIPFYSVTNAQYGAFVYLATNVVCKDNIIDIPSGIDFYLYSGTNTFFSSFYGNITQGGKPITQGPNPISSLFYSDFLSAGGSLWPNSIWNLTNLTNNMPNFSFLQANSNGQALISIYLSNGVVFLKQIQP